ncbi:UvrD-helicase domain-containing protein [Saprospiraceae bacterium]|jgi:DNA helicase-2/ATP-dependent DNA helicase PcrA|nr:UvrD-helicase domain-containing protein [Saprospiraceae bacterium]MDB4769239.1 UvrD-helicase domain-containing protein [Saprospiraceae bacterium]MDC3253270.1 UvrD-helicase domain-containing protein [bacterium]
MKSYLQELNDVQRAAVINTDGPVLVIAGPGSGKTRVLTYRIAHLIEEGVAPWEILALTFTNKSAREMKSRIEKVVGNKANRVWAGTFHSIFARILRVEADKIGYASSFTIYDTDDSKSLLNSIIKEMNLDTKVYAANGVRSRISSAKSNLITPKAYKENKELLLQDKMSKRPYIHAIYAKYMERCKKAGAMDFDDLLFQMFRLLHQNPDNVLEKYRKRFKYLLVDEFQDTNYLQYAIIKKFVKYENSSENICVVGDDAQSIYAFRGATIDNILDFEKEFKALKTFKLEQNYRSTDHIVQAANELIRNNQKQIPKKIWSDKGEGQKIQVIQAITDKEEGKRIADVILEQKNRFHIKNNEIAILYRTNSQSRIFEEYLRRYNIGYKVFGGLSFYQRKEVKDLIGYLRLTINKRDEEALKRVLNYPRRGIGKTTIDKISALAGETGKTMWECLQLVKVSARAATAINNFVKAIMNFTRKAEGSNAYEVAIHVAKNSGLIAEMQKDNSLEGLGRIENVNALLDGVKEFVENDEIIDEAIMPDKTLTSYLQNIALHTDMDTQAEETEFVTLMSVHSAKGLEFKSVFVVGLEENLFPSFMSMESKEGLDEERRLFYVAITRAEQYLTLSFARGRYKFGKLRNDQPSRFLNEISPQHFDTSLSVGGSMSLSSSNREERVTSGVKGNFKRRGTVASPKFAVDPGTFRPDSPTKVQTGMKVLHLRFGEGRVISIDGAVDNRVATIMFQGIESPERRIMLKYAKLQIL